MSKTEKGKAESGKTKRKHKGKQSKRVLRIRIKEMGKKPLTTNCYNLPPDSPRAYNLHLITVANLAKPLSQLQLAVMSGLTKAKRSITAMRSASLLIALVHGAICQKQAPDSKF
ncbi:hypothetical protein I315_04187 [Cryptococcus gattii Ru294]|nr:hypothetical protein I315_04187 [Cryptococcus gattii Ru294]